MNNFVKPSTQYWLPHGQEHYHSINNIKGFLAVDYFCPHCLQGLHHKLHLMNKNAPIMKKLCLTRTTKQVKSSKIGKDITHYLHRQDMKGGKDEVEGKIE